MESEGFALTADSVESVDAPVAMVDVHVHLLPGIDDGARDLAESLAMCETFAVQGVRTVVATPHMLDGRHNVGPDRVREGIIALNGICAERGIDLEVLPGADVRIAPGLLGRLEAGDILTLGDRGTHILLEVGPGALPPLSGLIAELLAMEVTPVISHPERHPEFWRRPGPLMEWGERGCLFQVTAGALMGRFGQMAFRMARALLDAGMVHAVASDAHSADGKRRPDLEEAFLWTCAVFGRDRGIELFASSPGRMAGAAMPHKDRDSQTNATRAR